MTETGFSDEKIADKIEKMRIKAEHANTTDEERDALLEMIGRWMEKYRIDAARIDAARLRAGKVGEKIVEKFILLEGTYAQGYVSCFGMVAKQLGVETVYTSLNRNKSKIRFNVIGYEADVDQAILLLQSIRLQAATQLESWVRRHSSWEWLTAMEKFKERRSFIVFFGVGAGEKIKEGKNRTLREEEAKEPGTELMLLDRAQLVTEEYLRLHPNVRTVKSRVQHTWGGADAGRAAGRNADTGDTRVGGNTQRRLG